VREALKQMRREKKAELRVAPEQYAELRDRIEDIRKDFPEIQLIDVVEDPALKPPQIVVETSIGRVEGDLGRHIEELERAITDAVHLAAPESGVEAAE